MIARIAAAAFPLALGTLAVGGLAVLTAWLRLVPPIAGFMAFTLAFLGGGVASLLLGVVSIFAAAGAGHDSRAGGVAAAAIGLGCLVLLGVLASSARGAPAIHDISTDTADPPDFAVATQHPANRDRDMSYPHGTRETPRLQQQAYADLRPIELTRGADDAFRAALEVAEDLGWTVVGRDATARTFEAEAETPVFRFVDDIAVRVRRHADGAIVDVRSTSRVGVGDMGVNANRIRRFRDALVSR